ncbi:MAG: hypothetical protein AB1631_14705 [Acidobacteriota bacterium]
MCKREVRRTTRHHLIPRSRHKSKKKKEDLDRLELHRVIDICLPCHRNIHAVLTERELEQTYNTVEKLIAYPQVARFLEWVRKQPDTPIRIRSSKAKRERKIRGK